MNVKGMTAGELSKMTLEQFENLNLKQAQEALTILNKAVTKSVRRAEAAGDIATQAPAYKSLMESGGKIKTRGYSGAGGLNMAKAEIKRASDYLNMKTRTVTGAKAHNAQAARYFGLSPNTTPAEVTEISNEVNRILEEFPAEFYRTIKQSYQQVDKMIGERLQKGNTAEDIRNALREQYERVQAGELENVKNYEQSLWSEFTNSLDESL